MTDPSDLPNPARPQASGIDSGPKPMDDRSGRPRPSRESGVPGEPALAISDEGGLAENPGATVPETPEDAEQPDAPRRERTGRSGAGNGFGVANPNRTQASGVGSGSVPTAAPDDPADPAAREGP